MGELRAASTFGGRFVELIDRRIAKLQELRQLLIDEKLVRAKPATPDSRRAAYLLAKSGRGRRAKTVKPPEGVKQ